MCLQEVKYGLNPVLPLCHFLRILAKLGLGEFFIVSPLGIEQSLAHFDRQVAAASKPLPQAFLPGLVLKVLIGLVLELLMILINVPHMSCILIAVRCVPPLLHPL